MKIWAVLFWLAIWQLGSMAVGKAFLLPSPWQVITCLGDLLVQASFWRAIGYTLARIALGFLSAAFFGTLLAASATRYRWVRELLSPLMLTVRTVPVASFIILALIWFSSQRLSVLISFLMGLPVVYANALEGFDARDQGLQEMALVFGLPTYRRILYIDLPQALPALRTGCTLALGLCWKAGVAAEVIAMPRGSIGERMQQAKVYLETPELLAWTITVVLLSVLFEHLVRALLSLLEKRLRRL